MAEQAPQIQPDLDWEGATLLETWPRGLDTLFYHERVWDATIAAAVRNAKGPVLEVGCGEAVCSEQLNTQGLRCVGLEPSEAMIRRALERFAGSGHQVQLVRGIAETMPFRRGSFDRVVSDASIDHLADPAAGVREMAGLLAPDGRLIIGVVNYGSLNVRLSRMIYWLARKTRYVPPGKHLFWDTPVPHEHTFECTYSRLLRICSPSLDLDYIHGVSIGWAFPMWDVVLYKYLLRRSNGVLSALDRIAYRHPRLADYLVSVWKPKRAALRQ